MGTRYEVQVVTGSSRRFDRAALPDSILQDPRYWREVITRTITARAIDEHGSTPPDARHRATVDMQGTPMLTGLNATEDRFDVIEPF